DKKEELEKEISLAEAKGEAVTDALKSRYSSVSFIYIGFEPNEIRLLITEEDRQVFCEIIADQEKMTDIIMDDYQFLLQHGHNGKGGNWIHIGWLLACTASQAEKILINPAEDLPEKLLAHIKKRFEEVPLAPVLIW
ncbi:6128_t:CDS:2, partial [Gigaspora margarita]